MRIIHFKALATILFTLTLISCSTIKEDIDDKENRGYVTKFSDFSKITPGKTTKEEALRLLGSPLTKSLFGKEEWIYAGGEVTKETFFEPEMKSFESYKIAFNEEGIVESIKFKDINSRKEFEISEDRTISGGNSLTFFQQLLGNVGRFNNQQRVGAGGGVGN